MAVKGNLQNPLIILQISGNHRKVPITVAFLHHQAANLLGHKGRLIVAAFACIAKHMVAVLRKNLQMRAEQLLL